MMHNLLTLAATLVTLTLTGTPNRGAAQSYPIDCAILLCLSGGWPASVPCARARAEFIRRITPWPVEPPLQIWRCPMAVSYQPSCGNDVSARLYDIHFKSSSSLPQSPMDAQDRISQSGAPAVHRLGEARPHQLADDITLQLIRNRADIDISGPEFNFVRSIHVYDVHYARQHEAGRDGVCNRSATVVLGTYGAQGDFAWARSSTSALPEAHVGLERWGEDCPNIYHRSVFVDWRDYKGNYGFEQVNY